MLNEYRLKVILNSSPIHLASIFLPLNSSELLSIHRLLIAFGTSIPINLPIPIAPLKLVEVSTAHLHLLVPRYVIVLFPDCVSTCTTNIYSQFMACNLLIMALSLVIIVYHSRFKV